MYETEIRCLRDRWEEQLHRYCESYWKKVRAITEAQCTIGILGMQSVGKSTLLNALIGFPVLPSMVTKGTVCSLMLRNGSQPLLYVYTDDDRKGEPLAITGRFQPRIFRRMLEYVCRCVNEIIFYPENINYFLKETKSPGSLMPEDFTLSQKNERHGLLLALIILNAYFTAGSGTGFEEEVAQERGALLKELGIDPEARLSLTLEWDSVSLPSGVVLVDLPGLGSGDRRMEELILNWIRHCDIVLCLTTGEAMGGLIYDILTQVYKDEINTDPPLPLLMLNKAEMVLSLEASRNAAKQMIPRDNVISCFLSSFAGEYRYLDAGIPLENTQYWRNEFFPELQSMMPRVSVTERERDKALKRLMKKYFKTYPCELEDGTQLQVSLEDIITKVLGEMAQRRMLFLLRRALTSEKQAASLLFRFLEQEYNFLSGLRTFPPAMLDIWFEEAEKALNALCRALSELEIQATDTVLEFQERLNKFSVDWVHYIWSVNKEISRRAYMAIERFSTTIGFMTCSGVTLETVDGSMKNDVNLKALYKKVHSFDIRIALCDVYQEGNATLLDTWDTTAVLFDILRRVIREYIENIRAIDRECRRRCAYLGYTDEQFDYYFQKPLQKMSETMLRDTLPVEGLPAISKQPVVENSLECVDWRRIQTDWLKVALDSATIIRGRKRVVLWRSRLLQQLSVPIIVDEYAQSLISPLVSRDVQETFNDPLRTFSRFCSELKGRLKGQQQYMFNAYRQLAIGLSEELMHNVGLEKHAYEKLLQLMDKNCAPLFSRGYYSANIFRSWAVGQN